jgi:hypothetical protein
MRPDRALLTRFSPATLMLAGILATVMGLLLALAGNTNAFGAAGNGFTPCLPGSQPIQVHYTYDTTPADPSGYGLNTFTLTGFDAGCDGDTVVLTISGNLAGDPAAAVTEVLGTYDTTLDPCTQQPAATPVTITNGTIVIDACPTYGPPAGPANLHDATLLHLEVDGQNLPVNPTGPTGPSGPVAPTTTVTAPTTTSSAPVTATSTTPVTTSSVDVEGTSTSAAASSSSTGPVTTPSTSTSTDVMGETFTKGGSGTVKSTLTRAGELPFTGSYAALTIWIGLLFLAGGLTLLILGLRRHKPADSTHRA